jgi:hypothetical protein
MTYTRRPGAGAPRKVLLCGDPAGRGRCVAAPIAFQLYGPGLRRGDGN